MVKQPPQRDLFLSACRNQQYPLVPRQADGALPQYFRNIESLRAVGAAASTSKDYFDRAGTQTLQAGPFGEEKAAKAVFPQNQIKRASDGASVDLTHRNTSIVLAERRACVAPVVDLSSLSDESAGADVQQVLA